MSQPGERVPIFLCCAEENEVALVGAATELRSQGLEPEVLTGVELDAGILGRAVDQNLGAGLYALCQSEDLDRFQIRRLEGLFSARKGPAHKLITVELDAERPLAIVLQITEAVDALESGQAGQEPDEDAPEASHLRDVVGPGYTGDRPRRAHAKEQATQPSHGRPKPSPGRTPAHRQPVSHGSDRDRPVPREHADTARTPAPQGPPSEVATPPSEPAASQADEATGAAGGQLPDAAPTIAPEVSQPRAESRGSALTWMGLGALVVVIAAGIALVQDRGSLGGSGERSAPRLSPAAPDAPTDVDHTGGESARPQTTGAERDTGDTGDTGDVPPLAQPLEEPPPPPDPSHPGPGEDTLMAAAIAEGKIRALDLLIFVPPRKGRVVPWLEAADHCRAKVVAGVRRFRLPSVQEIRKIRNARMLGEGDYWTGTLVASDRESVYVLDTSLRGVVQWAKEEEATPICVRAK